MRECNVEEIYVKRNVADLVWYCGVELHVGCVVETNIGTKMMFGPLGFDTLQIVSY
jgi:hypothetical protein